MSATELFTRANITDYFVDTSVQDFCVHWKLVNNVLHFHSNWRIVYLSLGLFYVYAFQVIKLPSTLSKQLILRNLVQNNFYKKDKGIGDVMLLVES